MMKTICVLLIVWAMCVAVVLYVFDYRIKQLARGHLNQEYRLDIITEMCK